MLSPERREFHLPPPFLLISPELHGRSKTIWYRSLGKPFKMGLGVPEPARSNDLFSFNSQDFPSTCLAPNDPGQCIAFPPKKFPSQIDLPFTSTGFADILAPRTRARRSTTTAVPGSQPPPSGNSSSQIQGQPWLPSSPPAVQRQNSAGAIMNSYPASPPRANRSPSSTGSPHMQPPHGYQSGAQSGPQGPYRSASGTSSPGTIREEPYGPEGSYPNTPGAYSTTPGYNTQYGATGYQASSAPMYATSPAAAYFQPQYSQSPYGTHQAAQPYSPQVTTPTQTGYPTTEYNNYASHGVSDGPPQPCNTYQDYQDQSRAPAPGYALTPAYPTSQQPGGVYQGQYQSPSSAYPSYANESSVRYTAAETPYSSDTARYGNEGGSSRAEYGYNYGNGSPGMQGQPGQRTHQQPGQYSGAEYRDQQTPGQQPWGGYGGSY